MLQFTTTSEISDKKKKKNVSRNQKLYWRKHTDIKDVEDFLNLKRLEERLGGPFKEKKNEELFVIDTGSSNDLSNQYHGKLTRKQKAELPLKCYEVLRPLTAVPDPIVKRNRVRSKEERKSKIRKSIEEKKRLCGIVPNKLLKAKQSRAITLRKKKLKPTGPNFKKDIWDCTNNIEKENFEKIEWLNENTVQHNLTNLGAFEVNVPKGIRKRKSILPTIELPHPGTSYNPSYKDHQDLLKTVAERELEKQKQETHIKRVTSDLFKKVTRSEKASTWIEEMSQGLPQTEEVKKEDAVKEENEEVGEYKAINPPVSFKKKKTKKQRRIQRLEKQAELNRKEAKIEKKKVADLYKLKFINTDIKTTEDTQLKNKEKREKLAAFNVTRTKRLASKPFEDQDPAFSRSCELKGNLRLLKSQGRILADRFYSLQKRNMLVPTVKRIGVEKPKRKSFVKASHKIENVEK